MNKLCWKIDDNYEIRSMTPEEFEPPFEKFTKEFFEDRTQVFRLRNSLSEKERERMKELGAKMGDPFKLRLGVFHKDKDKEEFVGWHFGRQESATTFYMVNSGILAHHRRKGLYAELVKRVVAVATEMGFQEIWSRHSATNNAVIIPKLKQGFVISAMEVTDTFGTVIHLRYLPSELRRKMTEYRVGHIKPDAEIKKHLGI